MDAVCIEAEQPADVPAIHAVLRCAFSDHSAVADMPAAIRDSPRYRPELTLVARLAGQVAGFVMLSGTDLVDEHGTRREVLTLTPLAVAPQLQRRGIGASLVRSVLAAADKQHEPLVVLEGSPDYYGALGFRFAPDHQITIDLPQWAPREAAQVYLLSTYDPAIRGHVEYPPAIANLASE